MKRPNHFPLSVCNDRKESELLPGDCSYTTMDEAVYAMQMEMEVVLLSKVKTDLEEKSF